MAARQTAHIFVSYSRSDRIAVDKLVSDLRRRHYDLWMDVDPQGIEPGEDWRAELVKQMSAAEAVLACGSPDFLASPYCREEIAQAQREGKPIYPVLVRRLNPGQSLEEVGIRQQYADLSANYDSEFKRLISVLPRPRYPRARIVQVALRVAGAVAAIALLLVAIALVVRALNPPVIIPTQAPNPTATPSLEGYDLKVVVAPFALDPSLSESDRRLANDLVIRLSRDMQRQLQALEGESVLDIGFLGAEAIPPLVSDGEAQIIAVEPDQLLLERASGLATARNFDMVFYGSARRGESGQFQIAPRLYVPPERFTEALEMTGSLAFGADVVLTNTNIDTAYQTSAELRARVEALVHVVQGMSSYIAHRYTDALQAFSAAASVPGWTRGRETLYLLQGNVYLQLARQAITACTRDLVLQQLTLAEQQYRQALPGDGRGAVVSAARANASLAEVYLMRSTWLLVDDSAPCDPQQADSAALEQALTHGEAAIAAADFEQLEPALQAAIMLTQARAQATAWYAVETTDDSRYASLAEAIDSRVAQIIDLYDDSPENVVLTDTVVEARLLRGIVRSDLSGACTDATFDDFQAALAVAEGAPQVVESSRRMFIVGALGQCHELNGQTEQAVEYYRAAYDIARTLVTGTVDRDFYGCKLQVLTGDSNAAAVTAPCSDEEEFARTGE